MLVSQKIVRLQDLPDGRRVSLFNKLDHLLKKWVLPVEVVA